MKCKIFFCKIFQQEYWFSKTQVKVISVAPYWIDTPFLNTTDATFPDLMDAFKSSQTDNPEYQGKVLE